MNVLFVSSEIYPFAKCGGLGDVAYALPVAMAKQGLDIRLLLPGYPEVLKNLENPKIIATERFFFGMGTARIILGRLPHGVLTYVIDAPHLYDRPGIYGDAYGVDWPDNHLRFAALGFVAAELGRYDEGWRADILHGHDWLCGLMPAYLKAKPGRQPKSIFTIHNLAYQGLFPSTVYPDLGLPSSFYTTEGVEFHAQVGFLKAGLYYADAITAVSPTYAAEIQQEELGCGLDGLLRQRSGQVRGILNGIDTEVWNPARDSYLHAPYSAITLHEKKKNRAALLGELGLRIKKNRPLFGVVSRLAFQKGLDLLPEAMQDSLREGAGLAILGTGDAALEAQLRKLSARWPGQVAVKCEQNETLAHRIMAGADAILVPSRFEPCGLVQMYGLRYGTLPVVRRTGGLADTVEGKGSAATGFVFDTSSVSDLAGTLRQVLKIFRRPAIWVNMQRNAMAKDFGWEKSAGEYLTLYQDVLSEDMPRRISA